MKTKCFFIGIIIAMFSFSDLFAQSNKPEKEAWDIYSDTWVGTDAVGRVQPTNTEVGDYKLGKEHTVGIFYVTWHDASCFYTHSPYGADVSKIYEQDPTARMNGSASIWQSQYYGGYHWGEPEYGYFISSDKYVIRHDVSMLVDAGVDVLILDITNGVFYWNAWNALFEVLEEMKSEGNKIPKIVFWNFNGAPIYDVQALYAEFYAKGKYSDLWFYWYGKPLLLYNATPWHDANGNNDHLANYLYDQNAATNPNHPHYGDPLYTSQYLTEYPDYIKDFFTLRNMWWGYYKWGGERYVGTEDNWSFGLQLNDDQVAALSPKQLAATHNGNIEEFAVTPAQHPVSLVGKCWTRTNGEPTLDEYDLPVSQYVAAAGKTVDDPEAYGIYFQDRWDEAIQANPQFLYLNDWNEFTAGKGTTDGSFMRRANNGFNFIDQYNAEFNRTIGPVKGRYTDNYYMQMTSNIRKYKGVHPIPVNYGYSAVSGLDTAKWNKVTTEYRDTKGDIIYRDFNGYGGNHYTNTLGRNDIVMSKVAVTADSLYFYAQTMSNLTSCSGTNWMLLFIDADKNSKTGWNGYDYVIDKTVNSATETVVSKYNSSTSTWDASTTARLLYSGNQMVIAVKRDALALTSDDLTFDFKWVDNPADWSSPISLATAGDAAPNRRFNYRFIWHKTGEATVTAKQKLMNLLEKYQDEDMISQYACGTNPGLIKDSTIYKNLVTAYNTGINEVSSSHTDAEYTAYYNNLIAAKNAADTAALVPIASTNGYYYITTANAEYVNNTAHPEYKNLGWAQLTNILKVIRWNTIDESNPNYIWKITKLSTDSTYSIQNYGVGTFINKARTSDEAQTITLTDAQTTPQVIRFLNRIGQVSVANTAFSMDYYQNGADGSTTYGTLKTGNGGISSGAAWYLKSADSYFIKYLKTPMDSLLALANAKISASTVMKDGQVDASSPIKNSEIKAKLDVLTPLVTNDAGLDMYSITKADITELENAYNGLLSVWCDTTLLAKLYSQALGIVQNCSVGDELGELDPTNFAALQTAMNEVKTHMPLYTLKRADLDSLTAKMQSVLGYYKIAVNSPKDGVWYNIISADSTIKTSTKPNGMCMYAYKADANSSVYWGGTPADNHNVARSGWRFVTLSDSTYALQNVGTGWYLGASAGSNTLLKMSETPVAYRIVPLGNKQWEIIENKTDALPVFARVSLHYVTAYATTDLPYSQASWIIKKVNAEDFHDSISDIQGKIRALTLPYDQYGLPHTVNGESIGIYSIVGSQLNADYKTIAIELAEYQDNTIPAGKPVIIKLGDTYSSNTRIPFILNPVINGTVVNQPLASNGLVGVLKQTAVDNDSCGYFNIATVTPITSSTNIAAQYGYLNAGNIYAKPNATVALTVSITGNGLLNDIAQTLVESSETVDVYTVDGILVKKNTSYAKATQDLAKGIYIVGKQKILVK